MTDETVTTPTRELSDDPAQAVIALQDTMEVFIETAHVDHVYGEPVQHGDTLVIPAAEVVVGLGFGAGYGSGGDEKQNSGGGGGGGGGGKTFSRPVAVVIATPEGVRVEPVVDVTKISLAMFTALGFMVGMATRMLNPKRAMKSLKGE